MLRGAWRRRWVRWLAILLSLPLIAYAILWLIFARNLPSAETLLNYEPPLPTNVRDIERRAGAELRPRAAGPAHL